MLCAAKEDDQHNENREEEEEESNVIKQWAMVSIPLGSTLGSRIAILLSLVSECEN